MTCVAGFIGLLVIGGLIGAALSLWNDERKHQKLKSWHQERIREEYQRGFEFAAELCKLKSKQPDMHNKVIGLLASGNAITPDRERQIVWEAK